MLQRREATHPRGPVGWTWWTGFSFAVVAWCGAGCVGADSSSLGSSDACEVECGVRGAGIAARCVCVVGWAGEARDACAPGFAEVDGVCARDVCPGGDRPRSADGDCDGVVTPDDCDDADPAMGARAGDADCDGFLTADDCDDADSVAGARADDADCDGVPTADDCDDGNRSAGPRADDADCDGVPTADDCDDAEPLAGPRADDADCDGVPTLADCDDAEPAVGGRANDADCDGVTTADDCDDANPAAADRDNDADCDGVTTADDCDDGEPGLGDRAGDADCDGARADDDCDDARPELGDRALDADCDGVMSVDDCDDDNAAAGSRAGDADCDGVATDVDCNDFAPHLGAAADDDDCDGTPSADDCDDGDPLVGAAADACERFGAECAEVVVPGCDAVVDCGGCGADSACVTNRCEPLCGVADLDGPVDDMVAMLHRRLSDDDITGRGNAVTVTPVLDRGYDGDIDGDGRVSRLDLSREAVGVNLAAAIALGAPVTVSFRLQPHAPDQSASLFDGGPVRIAQDGAAVVSAVDTAAGESVVRHEGSALDRHRCNHVAVVFDGAAHQTYVNGVPSAPVAAAARASAIERFTVGPYPGQIWDVRVYEAALSADAVDALAGYCADDRAVTASPWPEAPQYTHNLCGPYICLWWEDPALMTPGTESTDDELRYYLKMQEHVFEKHVFEAGMYPQGDLCGYVPPRFRPDIEPYGNTFLQLSEGIRTGFVCTYSYAEPMLHPQGGYWLHENFHSFQGALRNALGHAGTKFLLEASAEWGADFVVPGNRSRFPSFFTRKSYVPLYATQNQGDAYGTCTGGHQYGIYLFLAYLTRYLSSPRLIGDVFNDPRSGQGPVAAQVIADELARRGYDIASVFADMVARTATWGFEHGEHYAQWEATIDTACGPIHSGDFGPACTFGQWYAPPFEERRGPWSFNTYKVDAAEGGTYDVALEGAADNPAGTRFLARAVVHSPSTGARIYHSAEANAENGHRFSISVPTLLGDQLYLVVAATPPELDGYDRLSYRVRLTPEDYAPSDAPIKVFLMAGQSNMLGSNSLTTKLQSLVCHADDAYALPDLVCGDTSIDAASLRPSFVDTARAHLEAARAADRRGGPIDRWRPSSAARGPGYRRRHRPGGARRLLPRRPGGPPEHPRRRRRAREVRHHPHAVHRGPLLVPRRARYRRARRPLAERGRALGLSRAPRLARGAPRGRRHHRLQGPAGRRRRRRRPRHRVALRRRGAVVREPAGRVRARRGAGDRVRQWTLRAARIHRGRRKPRSRRLHVRRWGGLRTAWDGWARAGRT